MIPLTPKQFELLQFMRSCQTCPSYEEMRKHVGLGSKSGVPRLLERLEERGFIRRRRGGRRSVELVAQPNPLASATTPALFAELVARAALTRGQATALSGLSEIAA